MTYRLIFARSTALLLTFFCSALPVHAQSAQDMRNLRDKVQRMSEDIALRAQGIDPQKYRKALALQEAMLRLQQKQYAAALVPLKGLLAQGDPTAQMIVGSMYLDGQGVKRDYAKAMQYLTAAVRGGSTEAKGLIGYMYFFGAGVPKDYTKAFKWISADEKGVDSLYLQGLMLEEGLGVARNLPEALRAYSRAAARGSVDAKAKAGEFHFLGKGTPENHRLAQKLFEEAAAKNSPTAQLYLAQIYANGDGVEPDIAKATEHFRKGEAGLAEKIKLERTRTFVYSGDTTDQVALMNLVKANLAKLRSAASPGPTASSSPASTASSNPAESRSPASTASSDPAESRNPASTASPDPAENRSPASASSDPTARSTPPHP